MLFGGRQFPMAPATLEFEGKIYGKIGVRFKGNSSFASSQGTIKRPFKLDFDEFIKTQRFFGMTKISLNNNAMDASQIREALGYEIYRTSGIPAARTAFAKVFLTVPGFYDREYAGLYTVIEQIDERFLRNHFKSDQALLVKPERGLAYQGDDWEAYRELYDAKTEGTPAQQRQLMAFARLLNADDETFKTRISEVMDIDQFLRFLAVTTAEANIDSALAMGHNFYLLVAPPSNKVQWIPWDLNLAFDQKELSISHPAAGNNRFIPRLLEIPEMNRVYREHMRAVLDTSFRADKLHADIAAMARTIRAAVAQDQHVNFDLFQRLTSNAAESNLQTADETFDLGGFRGRRHFLPPGPGRMEPLKEWISGRVSSIEAQLSGKSRGRKMPDGPRLGRVGIAGQILGHRLFLAADANRDNQAARSEFAQVADEWFANWDQDGNGVLSQDEVSAGLPSLLRMPLRPGPAPLVRPNLGLRGGIGSELQRAGPRFLRAADGNADGQLTRLELRHRFGKWFDEWSAKSEGVLTLGSVIDGMQSIFHDPEPNRAAGAAGP
jgi:hypothetical protein